MTTEATDGPGVVARWYENVGRRDVEGLCSLADPSIEIAHPGATLPGLSSTSFHGHDGLRTLMRWSFASYRPARIAALDTRQIAQWTVARATYQLLEDSSQRTERHVLFEIEDGLVRRVRAFANSHNATTYAEAGHLTKREREILQLVATGLNAPEIAAQLHLSRATVHTHIRNAMAQLGAKTRVEAVALAAKQGAIRL